MTPDEVVKIISSLDIDCTNPTEVSEIRVTHEMALDAQDLEMEGQIVRYGSWERCGACPNCMFNQVKAEIITNLQDYQKLRERIDVATLAFQFYCLDFPDIDKQELLADWQGYSERLRMNYVIKAQSIVTYLQQPTEH
jgi:uncharacterized protein YuzB (UPF0349 family)